MTQTEILLDQESETLTDRHCVVIYNNDTTPYEIVINVLMVATSCDMEEAVIETWEAHHFGSCRVHFGSETECEDAADVIRTVGVRAEVCAEWSAIPV
jgi:ATP-dependent Clp protease adapter protein ClpS